MGRFIAACICLAVGHRVFAYGGVEWIELANGDEVPAVRAICSRCSWEGFRTTWGRLVNGSEF